MDFVFMLTRADQTVGDALEVLDDIESVGLTHVGFKDVGLPPAELGAVARRIKAMGAISYMEVVSTTPEACLASARVARDIGIDRLLGGTQVDEVLAILAGSSTRYLPFPGRPFDHPTKLGGSPDDVERDCRRAVARGCPGVDLLAYRATEAAPLDLVKAARRGTDGILLVAGGIGRPEQVRALAEHGVDSFTVGSAAFDGSFAPVLGSLRSQLRAVLDACR
ncbi:MAG TPA: HisA/HisF-related TIM barrel protein [Kofleriaceae bacterium]|nr:HisA/HisF-related TIM barrel protein [Kofleriaceae bacterium]